MRWLISISFILVLYFFYGFYISQFEIHIIDRSPPGAEGNSANLPINESLPDSIPSYEYRGVLNVLSQLSQGSESIPYIMSDAQNAGIDFVLMTDLNLFHLPKSSESNMTGPMALIGGKYNYLDSRLLHYAPRVESLGESMGEVQVALADMLAKRAEATPDQLLILAHPFMKGYSWNGDLAPALDGFEVINLRSMADQAFQNSKASMLWSLMVYPFNSKLAMMRLFEEPFRELQWFDQISQQRKVLMFAGAEASAKSFPFTNYQLKFPSYQRNFEIVSQHVLLKTELTGNMIGDRKKILSALKAGNFYIAFDLLGNPKGFSANMIQGNRIFPMGSELKYTDNLELKIQLPARPTEFFEIIVFRNGERISTINQESIRLPIKAPGVYRIQVRVSPFWPLPDGKRWVSWIYSNPFWVK